MSVKKSNGTPFSVWLGQLIIKVNNIPFKEWTQGYEDNLTIDETVKRYEERYGKTDWDCRNGTKSIGFDERRTTHY